MSNLNSIINLNSLLDLTARLYESDDEHFILNSTLLSLMGKLRILRGMVIISGNNGKHIPFIIKGNFEYNEELTGKFISEINEKSFLIPDYDDSEIEFVIPIKKSSNQLFAVIILGKSISVKSLSDDEHNYISLISNITANAISNARNLKSYKNEKSKAEKQNQLLSTLFEISKDFSKHLSYEQILKTLAFNLMGQLTVTRFAMFGIMNNNDCCLIVNRFGTGIHEHFLDYFKDIDFAYKVDPSLYENSIAEFITDNEIRVVSPMLVQGERRGLLIIGRKMNGEDFSDENLLFIEALGNSAMAAIENERLFKEELEKKKLESELEIALEIQRNLLPKRNPALQNFDISGTSIPSRHVGGDLFDFIKLDNHRWLIAIADVSGKGIPASLIMANFQAALRVLAMSGLTLKEIVLKINNLLYHNTSADKFVTSFFAIIDDLTGKINYINAGHNPPFVFRKNDYVEQLTLGGLILGFMENPFNYEEGEIHLSENEFIICYTDGVTEAEDNSKADYGELRLEDFTRRSYGKSSEHVIEDLIESVKLHLGNLPQNDDITILVIKKHRNA